MAKAGVIEKLETKPLSGAIGKEITGVNLSEPLDDETFARLHDEFLASDGVLVFPEQFLTPEALHHFGARWGTLIENPYIAAEHGVPDFPSVLYIENFGKSKTPTEKWHTDWVFLDEPPAITIVAVEELPPAGGDTMWANQYLAYERLSDGMKRMLEGLRGVFPGSQVSAETGESEDFLGVHPIVRTHPETGRKSLLVCNPGSSLLRFEDMTPEESRPLLDFLYAHATTPDITYRHRWRPGDVVIWDNRSTLHYGVHDYGDDTTRRLIRVTLGCEPIE